MKNHERLPHRRLAEGEQTGHAHEVSAGTAVLWEPNSVGESRVLAAPDGTNVVHQEHDPIAVPAGTYDVVRVREYDHFAEESREVVD